MPRPSTLISGRQGPSSSAAVPRLGDWDLHELLSRGTFSDVYRCSPVGCGSRQADYVLKRVRPSCESDRLAVELLRKEVRIGGQVSHPHLAPILAAHVGRPPYYVVMPYVEGRTLRERLQKPDVCLPHALWITRQVCDALVALHAVGWLHCDIKPENIFEADSGHALLLDLGLAQSVNSARHHEFVGTPNYAAPEWFTARTAATPACDIYSLGLTLYEMLCRTRYEQSGPRRAYAGTGHLSQSGVSQLPPRVSRLLRRMLSNEPLRRPSAIEVLDWIFDLEIDFLEDRLSA